MKKWSLRAVRRQLIAEMVRADLRSAKGDALMRRSGYRVSARHE